MQAKEGTPKTPKRRKKESYTISFRVDGRYLIQLEKGAARMGASVHEYARLKLLETLDRRDEERLFEDTEAIKNGIQDVRDDLAAALKALLLNLTELTEDEVNTCVEASLGTPDELAEEG